MVVDTTIAHDDIYAELVRSNAEKDALRQRVEFLEKHVEDLRGAIELYARVLRGNEGMVHPERIVEALDMIIVVSDKHIEAARVGFRENL